MGKYLSLNLLLYSILLLFFSSCGSEKNILFGANYNKNKTDSAVYELQKGNKNYTLTDQKIQPGYELKLNNLQNESLISGTSAAAGGGVAAAGLGNTYLVEGDSTVMLPVLGKVKLGGLSRENAENMVNALYQKSLLKNPLINLTITNLSVTLLGDFSAQGNFPLKKDKTHLTEILGVAGGINTTADVTKVKIIRGNPASPQVLMVNMSNPNFMADKRLYLQNNDIVYVAEKKSVQNANKAGKISSFVGVGLALINTIFLIYNFTR
ncbi:MAG: hypothetical protein EAZ51_07730 [Sphingobacteriales bacterium]|nr:MAG: hypothetical protein EAZ51_07730 [Sphingobacteriales bacterium]